MKATGIGLTRLLMPIFAFALAFSALAFVFTDRVVPAATFRYNSIRDGITARRREDGSRRLVLLQDRAGQMVFARSYDAQRAMASQVTIERRQQGRARERISARTMRWEDGVWVLREGQVYRLASDLPRAAEFDTMTATTLTLLPSDLARQQKRPEEMSFAELAAFIRRAAANGEDATRQLVDLHLKVSFPLTSFIVVLLGAPLGANARRAGMANSFGLGIVICFVFYSCVKAGQALGWNQVLAPWAGAWLANLAFGSLAVVLLWRAHK